LTRGATLRYLARITHYLRRWAMNRFPCNTARKPSGLLMPSFLRRSAAGIVAAFAMGALCVSLPAWGALYKWTDASGHVVYSDQPPPGDVKVETISGPPPPANPNAARELANKELDIKKQQSLSADNAKKAGQQRADVERLAASCRDSRAEVTRLSADQVLLYSVNEKGETVFMSDADRRKRRDTLETFIKGNCR
jgi:hypothetical protein